MSNRMTYNEKMSWARAEARKLGLTLIDKRGTPRGCLECYRFIKKGNRTRVIARAITLDGAIEYIDSGDLKDIVDYLKDGGIF